MATREAGKIGSKTHLGVAANVASADDGGKSVVLSDAADGIAALRRGFVDDIRRLHDNP